MVCLVCARVTPRQQAPRETPSPHFPWFAPLLARAILCRDDPPPTRPGETRTPRRGVPVDNGLRDRHVVADRFRRIKELLIFLLHNFSRAARRSRRRSRCRFFECLQRSCTLEGMRHPMSTLGGPAFTLISPAEREQRPFCNFYAQGPPHPITLQ